MYNYVTYDSAIVQMAERFVIMRPIYGISSQYLNPKAGNLVLCRNLSRELKL